MDKQLSNDLRLKVMLKKHFSKKPFSVLVQMESEHTNLRF